jgi:hypothetical protein
LKQDLANHQLRRQQVPGGFEFLVLGGEVGDLVQDVPCVGLEFLKQLGVGRPVVGSGHNSGSGGEWDPATMDWK